MHRSSNTTFLGLPPRERPRRRAQPRHHPAAGRPVERRRRSGREQHQGHAGDPASVRPAAVRRRPRPALPHADRHRLQPERRRGRRDRHRGRLDQEGRRRHRRDRQAGRRASASRGTATTTRSCARRKAAREFVQWASEKQRERMPDRRAVGVDQVRRVRHDVGLRRRTRRSATRSTSCTRSGSTLCFGETTELTGGEQIVAARCANDEVREQVHVHVRPLPGRDQPPQDQRPVGLAADQGQHRRRPDDDRGEGARQHPEDRQEVHRRRRDRQGRDADASGPVVHGLVERRGRDGDAVRGVGLRRCTSSRPGRAT